MIVDHKCVRGHEFLVQGMAWEEAAFYSPEPYKTDFKARAMGFYHEAAKDEHKRRMRGDKPDHVHLTYL